MEKNNKYGLSRYIPEDVKRQVRQRCGFGCVIDGNAIIQYHHFRPKFAKARTHDPNGITLLCSNCHEKANKGLLSSETIVKADQNPVGVSKNFTNFAFDLSKEKFPELKIGGATFIGNPTIIEAFGERLLFIEQPDQQRGPFLINARFFDNKGREIASIVRNEWIGYSKNWDMVISGQSISIRNGHRDISLVIVSDPPNRLIITRMNMFYRGFRFVVEQKSPPTAYLPDGRMWFQLGDNVKFLGNQTVFSIG